MAIIERVIQLWTILSQVKEAGFGDPYFSCTLSPFSICLLELRSFFEKSSSSTSVGSFIIVSDSVSGVNRVCCKVWHFFKVSELLSFFFSLSLSLSQFSVFQFQLVVLPNFSNRPNSAQISKILRC